MKTPIIPSEQIFITTKASCQLDYKAICCFAATGFFLDDDTYYTNQKVLKPARTYKNEDDLVGEPYFKWHYSPRDITFEQAADEFSALFDKITSEQVKDKHIILPLSGGLDSRSQASALKGYKHVHTYSYKFSNSFNETKYGKEIAKRMGWSFSEYKIPNGYLWEVIDNLAQVNKCYSEFTAPRQMAIDNEFEQMGTIFYLGHWGDVLFDDMGVENDLSFEGQVDWLMKKIVKKGGLEFATALWKSWDLEGNFAYYLRERLSSMLSTIGINNANAQIRAFKSMYWAPRWTSVNLSIFQKHHPLALPYYDNRMCEFICTIPEEYLAGRKLQIEYIKRKTPELASIPWQTYDPCNLYNYSEYHNIKNRSIVFSRKIIRRLTEVLTNKVCTQRNWEIQFLGKKNDIQLKHYLLQKEGIVPKEVSTEFYHKFIKGNHTQKVWYSHPISMLLTFRLFK